MRLNSILSPVSTIALILVEADAQDALVVVKAVARVDAMEVVVHHVVQLA